MNFYEWIDLERPAAINKPFVRSGYEYATDGNSCIAVKTYLPDTEHGVDILKAINNWEFLKYTMCKWECHPVIATEVLCDECKGTGRGKIECRKCLGYGTVECSECGHEDDCKDCNGFGKVLTNASVCECCNGTKIQTDYSQVTIRPGVLLGGYYVEKINRIAAEFGDLFYHSDGKMFQLRNESDTVRICVMCLRS